MSTHTKKGEAMPRLHSDWIQSYIEYTSHTEAPTAFHFWTAVSTIAGALQKKAWIDQKYFTWTPNFYIILVGPAGVVQKSTTAALGQDLLSEVPDVHFGPQSITWQRLIQRMAEAKQEFVTPDGYYHDQSAINIVSSELGSFLDPSNSEMIDVLVDLWDGKKGGWEKDTKTSGGETIDSPWINFIGCTTPSWIQGHFPEYMIGGGFTSRCIFVYADKKRKYVPYPDESVPPDHAQKRERLITDLKRISNLVGEFRISEEAREWGRDWYQRHFENPPEHLGDDERFASYVARKQVHLHKLAMILSVSESDSLVIEPKHLEMALELLDAHEKEMPKVFNQIGQNDDSKKTYEVLRVLSQHGGWMPTQQLFRKLTRLMSYKDFDVALTSAAQAGYIKSWDDGGVQKLKFIDPEGQSA